MLDSLLGNPLIEKILFYLLKNKTCYGTELKRVFDLPLFSVQRALQRLEKGGVLISRLQGKTRVFEYNPQYPFFQELKTLLEKAYSFVPTEARKKYYERPIRRRPRRSGKPL